MMSALDGITDSSPGSPLIEDRPLGSKWVGSETRWLSFFPVDHRKDRTGEIGRGVHQSVSASSFKFVSGTIYPQSRC